MFTRNSGLPSVLRWSTCASSAGNPCPGKRRARYSSTAAALKNSRGISSQYPCSCSSCWTQRNGCALAATSAGRYVPRTSRRAGSRRRASMPSRSMVAESLQCRSSSSSTSGGVPGQGLQGLDQLAQHPTPAGPVRTTPHGLHVAVAQQSRKLLQPGRRMLLEHLDQLAHRPPRVPVAPALPAPADTLLRLRTAPRIARYRCAARSLGRLPRGTSRPGPSCRFPARRSRTRAAAARRAHSPAGRASGPSPPLGPPASTPRSMVREARDGLDVRLAFGRCGTRQQRLSRPAGSPGR